MKVGGLMQAFLAILLIAFGVLIGYSLSSEECEECPVGFATLRDMEFLVDELRHCKEKEQEF